jgi:hypothetical protein
MYEGINTINMNSKIKKLNTFFLLLLFSLNTIAVKKTITYSCTGLSQFELVGSSGIKEEIKSKDYKFVDGTLHDLNNIKCDWGKSLIKCESNFLNIRKLSINLNNNEIKDYLSGNKGFGVYIENFKGQCEKK